MIMTFSSSPRSGVPRELVPARSLESGRGERMGSGRCDPSMAEVEAINVGIGGFDGGDEVGGGERKRRLRRAHHM